jgi:anaerobic selenocysteine-containing dehydrogenase
LSEDKKESIADAKIGRRSVLKWTGALAAAAVVGVGVGFETSQLMKPTTPTAPVETATTTGTATTTAEEQMFLSMWKEEGALKVFVKDGRISRMEPFGGADYVPSVFHNAERYTVYAPQRIQYPMKRVGWEPGGKSSIANRGKGEFVRITWEEAYNSIVSELKRMNTTYGPGAMLFSPGGHCGSWMFHSRWFFPHNFFSLIGGYTTLGHDGLSWGASRPTGVAVAGAQGGASGCTKAPTEESSFFLKYSKMMVFWCKDPLVNDMSSGAAAQGYPIIDEMRLWKQAGIKIVCIDPSLNETGKNFADTWIPIHPFSDEALAAAIAYTWISEGTYDQQYLDTHTIGFDEEHMPPGAPKNASFRSYIMGLSDGLRKTPEWAEPITGVKARIIRALARAWASKPTGLMAWRGGRVGSGGYVRFMYTLLAMQGLGKPGIGGYGSRGGPYLWRDGVKGFPSPAAFGEKRFKDHDTSENIFGSWPSGAPKPTPSKFGSIVYKWWHLYPESLEKIYAQSGDIARFPNTVLDSNGNTVVIRDVLFEPCMTVATPDKPLYHRYNIGPNSVLSRYPEPGYSPVHAYFEVGGNWAAREPNCNQYLRALLNPKFEFIVHISQFMNTNVMLSDIVLPAVTNFERNDISFVGLYDIYSQKCIEPLYEAKSDFDIFNELAKRMGVYDKYIAGPDGKPLATEDDWLKFIYENATTLPKYYTWEEFKKKAYHEWKVPDTWHSAQPNSWNWKAFWQSPASAKRNTESGLIEIYSQSVTKIAAMGQSGFYLIDDPEMKNQVTRKYESPNPGPDPNVPGGPVYLSNPELPLPVPTGWKYPIAIMSSHPKFAYHVTYQNVPWLQDEWRKEIGGYLYSPILMSTKDAADRGIKQDDSVRVFNNRGQILCYANVSERMTPGVAHVTYGVWNDYAEPGNPASLDKSGNIEGLVRGGFIGPYDNQMDVTCVAQVEKWKG